MARSSSVAAPARRIMVKLLMLGGAACALWLLVEGGEYGTSDLFSQRARHEALQAEVTELRLDVDSLTAELKVTRTDKARLERVARERYGMVRGDKEILYWVNSEDTDSTAR